MTPLSGRKESCITPSYVGTSSIPDFTRPALTRVWPRGTALSPPLNVPPLSPPGCQKASVSISTGSTPAAKQAPAPSITTVPSAPKSIHSTYMVSDARPARGKIGRTLPHQPSPAIKTPPLPTPIDLKSFFPLIDKFVDAKFLINGFSFGFDLAFAGNDISQSCNNNLTVNKNPNVALSHIQSEITKGRIAGPFKFPPFDKFRCSPLALREKSTPGQFRLLHNLSYPHNGTSVNENIPKDFSHTSYATIDDALEIISSLHSPYLAKADIAEAFRLLPLHPNCYNLTGFRLNDLYYYDRCLPMGASSSCAIFEIFGFLGSYPKNTL